MEAEGEEEFDLNEGLTAMAIIEAYDHTYPEPQAFEDDYVTFTEEWIAWREKLVEYAEGWKACIAHQKWRIQWERDIETIDYLLAWVEDNLTTVLWWRHQNLSGESLKDLRDCEGVESILWCDMLSVDIDNDDWNYRPLEEM